MKFQFACFLMFTLIGISLLFSCKEEKKDADTIISDITGGDSSKKDDDIVTVQDVVLSEEELAQPVFDSYVKCEGTKGNKTIGEECTDHCECETGWCYDEGYMAPFRYCTRPCEGSCGEGYKCLLFLPAVHNVKHTNICMPICNSIEECKQLSEKYNYCPPANGETKWSGYTLAMAPTCQTENMAEK